MSNSSSFSVACDTNMSNPSSSAVACDTNMSNSSSSAVTYITEEHIRAFYVAHNLGKFKNFPVDWGYFMSHFVEENESSEDEDQQFVTKRRDAHNAINGALWRSARY